MNSTLAELKARGFYSQCTDIDSLSSRMDSSPITFYVGCDPTGPSLHIGHMVPFLRCGICVLREMSASLSSAAELRA